MYIFPWASLKCPGTEPLLQALVAHEGSTSNPNPYHWRKVIPWEFCLEPMVSASTCCFNTSAQV